MQNTTYSAYFYALYLIIQKTSLNEERYKSKFYK